MKMLLRKREEVPGRGLKVRADRRILKNLGFYRGSGDAIACWMR